MVIGIISAPSVKWMEKTLEIGFFVDGAKADQLAILHLREAVVFGRGFMSHLNLFFREYEGSIMEVEAASVVVLFFAFVF